MTAWLGSVPMVAAPALVALVLLAEAALLIGVLLPAASVVLGLGVLVGAGAVSFPVAVLSVAAATVLGAALGHRAGLRHGRRPLALPDGRVRRALSRRVAQPAAQLAQPWVAAVGRRPLTAAAAAQFVAGGRTLAPRIAAQAGVPLATMLRGTVPAALVWSTLLIATGAFAATALPLLNAGLALLGIPVLVTATWVVVRRRSPRTLANAAHPPDRAAPTACRAGNHQAATS